MYRYLQQEDCDTFIDEQRVKNKIRVNHKETARVSIVKDLADKAKEYNVNNWDKGNFESTLINRNKKFKLKRKKWEKVNNKNSDDASDEVY